jgi:hypothetical protein
MAGAGELMELLNEDRGLVVRLAADVLFVTDQAALQPWARARLAAVAETLRATTRRLVIEGHTDVEGSAGHNQDLSSQRAVAVRDLLAGYGIAAAHVIRMKPDGSQMYEPVAQFDAAQSAFMPVPIDFGDSADRLFLALYGTGLRGASASVRIAGRDLPVLYAGPQNQYPGLDQANIELPRSLAGAGDAEVTLTLDDIRANTVTILFR